MSKTIDVLGHEVELDLEDEDIVVDVVVIVRCQRLEDSEEAVLYSANESISGSTQLGLLQHSTDSMREYLLHGEPDDD